MPYSTPGSIDLLHKFALYRLPNLIKNYFMVSEIALSEAKI
jgi:hypothetical protein